MSVPLVPADAIDLLDDQLMPYAVAVGALCNDWARLESGTRMLFFKVSDMPIERKGFGIVHCLDFRDLLRAIKVAFVDKEELGQPIITLATATIDYVDNVLRNRRNRYVHDMWNYDRQLETVERINHAPRIFRPQSHRPQTWEPGGFIMESVEDLWLTVREVRNQTRVLSDLQPCFDGKRDEIEKLLQSSPPRRF